MFPTGHVYGLVRPDGVEVLVHIGINTVDLSGDSFTALVKQGDIVKAGQEIARFNRQSLLNKGYDTTIMTIFTDTKGQEIKLKQSGKVFGGDLL